LRQAYARRTGNNLDEMVGDDEIMSLAFLPGLSTSEEVTAIAGRGVGLDVVRQGLANIQGRISVDSTPGVGTTFNLIVPTSLMMTRGLLVRVGKERYALPLLAIEKIIEPGDSFIIGGRQMITVDNKPLALVSLAQVLRRPVREEDQSAAPLAVILSVADQRLALLVDDVLTEQELAVKALGLPLRRVMNIAGAALMGNGDPVVILNPADLVHSARQVNVMDRRVNGRDEPEAPQDQIHVLVVDDSITTRTLEKNILEAAGYRVTTATDGHEAIKRLEDNPTIRIVVTDVEMPQMDGIALVQTIRASEKYNHLPLVLVTSLESREDRERGMVAGADAYIVKRGFDQAELLATIQYLL
jgi:two-component system chemotaxis sensor kinase CheA